MADTPETVEFSGAILFCPLCCSPVDVTALKETEFFCTNCEQSWTMILDGNRIAGFSV